MGATLRVSQWIHYLQHEVLTSLSQTLVHALGLFSLALAEARSCQSGRLAAKARSPVLPASRRRRWERLLANPRFDSATVQTALAQAIAQRWFAPVALQIGRASCRERV